MRVVINAQVDPDTSGGIAQVLAEVASGFAELAADDLELLLVCSKRSAAWLAPHVGESARIVVNDRPQLPPVIGARVSDGFFESFEPDVVHFPYQSFTRLALPTVFNPHDLQHVHLPDFFAPDERARRDALFRDAFHMATCVAVATKWVADDVADHFPAASAKTVVIPWAPPFEGRRALSDGVVTEVLAKLDLQPGFAIYPAVTWPHKNHVRLLEALHLAAVRWNCRIPLVCTGHQTEFFDQIRTRASDLKLGSQVRFLGRVADDVLAALYHAARLAIIPTLFEAGSFPLLEAFAMGVPVACSNVTSLPDLAGDAAVLFDPRDVESIAHAARTVFTDEPLRQTLARRGHGRVAQFSRRKTAQMYADVYRRIEGRSHGSPASGARCAQVVR